MLLLGSLMALPMLMDGTYQMISKMESTNSVRSMTGLLCSLGMVLVLKTALFH